MQIIFFSLFADITVICCIYSFASHYFFYIIFIEVFVLKIPVIYFYILIASNRLNSIIKSFYIINLFSPYSMYYFYILYISVILGIFAGIFSYLLLISISLYISFCTSFFQFSILKLRFLQY